jgi:Flavin containing amine oxidoreductase
MPAPEWFAAQNLGFAREAFVPIANAAEFGFIEHTTPAAYVLKFLAVLNRFSLAQQLTLALPKLREGNQELWQRIAATHDVRLGAPVRRIERDGTIRVTTDAEILEFDRLIWTAPIDEFAQVADSTPEEQAVCTRVRTIQRAIVTCRVEGLPPNLFYVIKNTLDNGVPRSYPHVLFEVAPGSKIYTFYPFVDEHTTSEEIERHVQDLVRRLGGTAAHLIQPPLYWKWFPHFAGEDISTGIYERFEALQGTRNTFFAGEILAG